MNIRDSKMTLLDSNSRCYKLIYRSFEEFRGLSQRPALTALRYNNFNFNGPLDFVRKDAGLSDRIT